MLADDMMFFELGTIVQRHIPAAEVDDLCAGSYMRIVKRCLVSQSLAPLSATKKGGRLSLNKAHSTAPLS
jgi:hypothetical protein